MTDEAKKIVDALRDQDDCDMLKKCDGCVREKYCYAENGENLETDAADMIDRLSDELEQARKERDAAIRDARLGGHCKQCKFDKNLPEDDPCLDCVHAYGHNDRWQWRGVCAENSKDGAE